MGRSVDVVIVGAGIAALSLAVALQDRKIPTLLLDARKSVDSTPRGLSLQPNGLEALDKLGVLGEVQRSGSRIDVFEIHGWDGELLLEADYGLLDHPFNYLHTVNLSELDLHLRYLAERRGAEIVWGARFQDLLWKNGQVVGVRYNTEQSVEEVSSSLVVGADGSKSGVRKAMGSRAESHDYEDAFIVGLVGPVPGLGQRARQYQGPGMMLGIMPMRSTTYLHYCVGPRNFDEVKQAGLDQLKSELVQVEPGLEEALRSVGAWTALGYFLPSRSKADQWVGNGTTLLGDSVHTLHPHSGQGLNLSLQDAMQLAEIIGSCYESQDFSAKALWPYQESRKKYADVMGSHAHYSATYALSKNWLVRRLNKRALHRLQKNRKLLKQALALTAGVFDKEPGLLTQARIGGILP